MVPIVLLWSGKAVDVSRSPHRWAVMVTLGNGLGALVILLAALIGALHTHGAASVVLWVLAAAGAIYLSALLVWGVSVFVMVELFRAVFGDESSDGPPQTGA